MIVKAWLVAGLALACGGATLLRKSSAEHQRPTEKWLEKLAPSEVMSCRFLPSSVNPQQSYKMSDETYRMLKPYGIVSRIFQKEEKRFDAVLIAGDNADSFHDQRACFSSQGWKIEGDRNVMVEVPGKGPMQAVELHLSGPNGVATALYSFRGPSGKLFSRFNDMWKDYFMAELFTGRVQKGEFFRFIDLEGGDDTRPLYKFAGEYLAQAMDSLDKAGKGK